MSIYKCNLVLAGFGKSGTSSLHAYLALHPRIVMSKVKEPHYFSVENNWKLGPGYHNSLFESAGKSDVAYYGESSTTYSISEVALKRIHEQLVEPKIIFIVRDPVDRAVSHYRWLYTLGLEKRPILEALEKDGFGFDPNRSVEGNYMSYLQESCYSQYIPQWQEKFGENNVLVLFTDELGKNPTAVLNRCFDFLGIGPIGDVAEIYKNRTESSSIVKLSPLAKVVIEYVPQAVRNGIKKIPLATKIWTTATQHRVIVNPPQVSTGEMVKISNMMPDEVNYYGKLRKNYSLFD